MGRKSLRSDRRKEIIQAFYKTAKKEGLHNVSIGKLAGNMGINPSLIIHYFSSKEELILGLIEYILDRYKNLYKVRSNKDQTSLEALHEIIDNLFSRKWNKLVDDDVYYNCFTFIFRDDAIKEKFKALHDSLRLMLNDILQRCKKDGYLVAEDTHQLADLVFLFLDGAYYYLSMVNDPKEYENKMEIYKNKTMEILDIKTNVTPVHSVST
ncbi:TetR/AcrR family transcriptional regulator [Fulvivirga sp. M361]|uniref:TetR family transcriptional regulator n=1 Tax=Fulvivirga sp. M361 TaxID=2594266 RepID=UPI00117ABE14|nr:TetR family transcriptional regulator [Fulvivirga sp. M361]TRX59914.1 TetR/AcrR family transcriptional regulator [Fulvivirga sp. M361]